MQKKLTIIMVCIFCVTFIGHLLFFYFGTALNLAPGTRYHDYESFLAVVEAGEITANDDNLRVPITVSGKVVCEFTYRNHSVLVRWDSHSDDALPITLVHVDDYAAASQARQIILWSFFGLYALELLAGWIAIVKTRPKTAG